ncbi:hypothetical protein [Kribbella sp. CA-294648]|uniref:hypothetical protein n=1 Tax=Kribbella sp. CA-294648 TaxID=3239948 RepID=UPI003D940027
MQVTRKIRALVIGSLAAAAATAGVVATGPAASAANLRTPVQLSIGNPDVLEVGVGLNQPVQFGFNNNTNVEKWRVEYTGVKVNGRPEFKLRSKQNNQCLGATSAKAGIQLQTKNCNLSNTRWYIGGDSKPGPKPLYLSGTNLVVTKFNKVQLQPDNGSANQQVKFRLLYGQTA